MSKKLFKNLICLASIAAIIAGVIYFFTKKKKDNTCEEKEVAEEALDAGDALDLSSLKFSRNYVDLR